MAQSMTTLTSSFRESFRVASRESLQWFPGHMHRSLQIMQRTIKQVDCVVEVHDARIPFSGRNPNLFQNLVGPKPHILVLNKKDLIPQEYQNVISKKLKEGNIQNVIFTNSKDQMCRGLKQLVSKAVHLISESDRFNRAEETKLRMMVIGVPNVGKSSLINGLRNRNLHKGRANPVGAVAGITRAVQTDVKVHLDPPIYLVDTPGILPPHITDVETAMKLALCACLKDSIVGEETIADFLLYWLNKTKDFKYVEMYKLKEPTDNIMPLLVKIAVDNKKFRKHLNIVDNSQVTIPDTHTVASSMIKDFRKGLFGKMVLDSNLL